MEREGHVVCQGQRWLPSLISDCQGFLISLCFIFVPLRIHVRVCARMCMFLISSSDAPTEHTHARMGSQPGSLID